MSGEEGSPVCLSLPSENTFTAGEPRASRGVTADLLPIGA